MRFKRFKQLIVESFSHPLSDSVVVTNGKGDEYILRTGGKFRNIDLSGADLSGTNLSGMDLSEANLSGANLCFADLRKATLNGADLRGAKIIGVKSDDPVITTKGGFEIKVIRKSKPSTTGRATHTRYVKKGGK
jgi:hypothetical protein